MTVLLRVPRRSFHVGQTAWQGLNPVHFRPGTPRTMTADEIVQQCTRDPRA